MRSWLKKIIFVLILVALIVASFKIKVRHVEVTGNTRATDMEIVSQVFTSEFDKISVVLFINEKLKKHKDLIFVDDYKIKWITPFSIEIEVEENEEVGFVKRSSKYVYFDKKGIINEIAEERKPDVPEVLGVNFKSLERGKRIDLGNKQGLNALLQITTFSKENDININLIEISSTFYISLYIDNLTIRIGDLKNIEVKLQRLNDIYPKIKDLSGVLDLTNARENMVDEQYIFKKTS